MNFALIGAAGYIAPRHMQAIKETGHQLVAAVDPHDCVGRLDEYFPDARFFTEIERFDRFLEKRRRGPEADRIHYISICSPNYLHDAHVRLALRVNAQAICEKPLVISPWNLDALAELESETNTRIHSVLQMRLIPAIRELKSQFESEETGSNREPSLRKKKEVCLKYVTRRGRWYDVSWKGSIEKSGGVAMNIGIHFFDMLLWLFGDVHRSEVHHRSNRKLSGSLELSRANVSWFLSTDEHDLPESARGAGQPAHRSMTIDGREFNFSTGLEPLHTEFYRTVLANSSTGIAEARPAVELVHEINNCPITQPSPHVDTLSPTSTPDLLRKAA